MINLVELFKSKINTCFWEHVVLQTNLVIIIFDHVVGVDFKGPLAVGTPGINHSVAHLALVGPCHFLFWLP